MQELLLNPDFWIAMTGLAWPVAIVVVAFAFRKLISGLFSREKVSIEIAGMKLSVEEATETVGKNVSSLIERVATLEERLGNESTIIVQENNFDRRKISVLWVDDFPSNNAFLIEQFENSGVYIRKELSTDAGIKALNQQEFDAIISDLGRVENGQDNEFAGLDLTRAVRASGNGIPILIFAGKRAIDNKKKLVEAGATEVTDNGVDVIHFVRSVGGM